MNSTEPSAFDGSMQAMNLWLDGIRDELGWHERQRAYRALRAVLHALRDHLPLSESSQLATQMPQMIRGLYYEGWIPSASLPQDRHWGQFLAHVSGSLGPHADPEAITQAVVKTLARHVSLGEMANVKDCLPEEIRRHWG